MGSEPDPPPAGSGEKVRHQYFSWARRGFDPTEVREFLATVASAIETLETELRQARAAGDFGRLEERFARLIAVAEREAETTLEEAKAEAATIVSEAMSETESIRSATQSEARRAAEESRVFLEKAKEESGRTLSDLAEQRRQMNEKLRQTQERLLGVAQDLEPEA